MTIQSPAANLSERRLPGRARTDEAKQQVRQRLIDAGRELIAHEGMAPVSLRQIARHAHYSPAVVYRYFPDKAALLMAIRDEALDRFADRVEGIFDREVSAEERLFHVADAGFQFAIKQASNFGMNILTMLWNRSENDPAPQAAISDPSEPGARVHELYERVILQFFDELENKPMALDMAVAAFMSIITGATALPAGSKYRAFPDQAQVMHTNLEALIARWKHLAASG